MWPGLDGRPNRAKFLPEVRRPGPIKSEHCKYLLLKWMATPLIFIITLKQTNFLCFWKHTHLLLQTRLCLAILETGVKKKEKEKSLFPLYETQFAAERTLCLQGHEKNAAFGMLLLGVAIKTFRLTAQMSQKSLAFIIWIKCRLAQIWCRFIWRDWDIFAWLA